MKIKEDLIEIRRMILGLLLVDNLFQKIEPDKKFILDQAIEMEHRNLDNLKIKCKEESASNYIMLNGDDICR